MTISTIHAPLYCARQHTRDGRECVGMGFSRVEAIRNCIASVRDKEEVVKLTVTRL